MGDIERTREIGATELILDFHTSARNIDDLVDTALSLTDRVLIAA